jgi:hypothetical protein
MARRVQIVLEDDIDGTPAEETVAFALDGIAYEIDLSEANAERLRSALEPFRAVARTAEPEKRRRRPAKAAAKADPAAIREWARAQGIAVNDRGRIPADVVARYTAEHQAD